nr:hypothetical protein [Tanacetum cinerariifolium]
MLAEIGSSLDKSDMSSETLEERMNIMHKLTALENIDLLELAKKAKIKWSTESEENSKYHGIINKQRNNLAFNGILVDGAWIEDPKVMRSFLLISKIERSFTKKEIKRTMWDCDLYKSPGSDGFTFGFYRRYWSLLERYVVDAVNHFFTHGFCRKGGANNLMKVHHTGIATKEKLKKVIAWVLRVEPILDKRVSHNFKRNQKSANWKFPEETQNKDCLSLLEVSHLNDSCNASFLASVGEMFLPIANVNLPDVDEERMFIRSRICSSTYENLAEDLICTGCQLCGAPLNSEFGSRIEQETVPLYCWNSSNRLHVVSLIYRPFL